MAASVLPEPNLPVTRLRFRFAAGADARLPTLAGPTWRGAIGHALRHQACLTGSSDCGGCLLRSRCSYAYLFETPPPPDAGKMRRYPAVPHPYVLEPQGWLEAPGADEGPIYELGCVLVGTAAESLPVFARAVAAAGRRGVGPGRPPFELISTMVEAGIGTDDWRVVDGSQPPDPQPVPVPDVPERITLRFETPLRVQRKGRVVRPEQFELADLFAPLLRRISLLTYFHTPTPLEADFAALTEEARQRPFRHKDVHWRDHQRHSNRQKGKVPLGGIMGTVTLDLREGDPLWPFLWLGQWVHAGKGTTMGLGRYRIEAETTLSEPHSGRAEDRVASNLAADSPATAAEKG